MTFGISVNLEKAAKCSHVCFRPFQKAAEWGTLPSHLLQDSGSRKLAAWVFHVGHGYSIPCLQK